MIYNLSKWQFWEMEKCFGKVFDNYELRIMNYENLLAKNRLSECEIRINKINTLYEQKR